MSECPFYVWVALSGLVWEGPNKARKAHFSLRVPLRPERAAPRFLVEGAFNQGGGGAGARA